MIQRLIQFSFVIAILALHACCNNCDDPTNPDCDNYDPCYGKKTVNTYFKMRAGDNGFPAPPQWCIDQITPCDTFGTSSIVFEVPDGNEGSTYKWQIGDDSTIRTGRKFELSFYDHLKEVGWEIYMPINLTIRTPYSSCLENPADTLITVTRNIFFTEDQSTALFNEIIKDTSILVGKFSKSDGPDTMKIYYNKTMKFRGETPAHWLIIGTPMVDTLMMPERGCGYIEGCGNFKHGFGYYLGMDACPERHLLSMYLTRYERRYYVDNNPSKYTLRFTSTTKGYEYDIEFTGKRIN